jgi:predicted alpha/beta hydrolase
MEIRNLSVPATDGYELAATYYSASNKPRAAVLINSAAAVKRRFYDQFAQFLAEQGFSVITYDFRGIGGSRPRHLKNFEARMRDWGEKDIAGVIRWIDSNLKPSKLFAVSHSAGGQLIGIANNNSCVNAMIMVAVQSGYWRLYNSPKKYQQYISARFIVPMLTTAFGYLPMKRLRQGEDMPKGVALEWARWCLMPNYMLSDELLASKANFRKFKGPILAYSIADDAWATRRAVDNLMQFYSAAQVTRCHLDPEQNDGTSIGHFGFFQPTFRRTLWCETADWLNRW